MLEYELDENGVKKTPMYDLYVKRGAKITDFGGWAMPIQFTSIQEEHEAVRNRVGLFDASHMGEIEVTGDDVIGWINKLITNDATKVENGQAQYCAMTKEDGNTLDDLIWYKDNDKRLMITCNAGNQDKIYNWVVAHNENNEVNIDFQSNRIGLVAIQGPKSEAVLAKVTDADLSAIKYYHFERNHTVAGVDNVVISRTGYTGEDGFELYIPWNESMKVWEALYEAGQEFGIAECALGARDTLRLEAGLPLYGNDLSEEINPYEGGIAFFVKLDKEADFPGKEALKAHKALDKKRVSRGFEITGKGIARQHYLVYDAEGNEIGEVTSATKGPTVGKAIGFMLVDKDAAPLGGEVFIDIRGKKVAADVVKKDWLKR